jgi:hypothetical protein
MNLTAKRTTIEIQDHHQLTQVATRLSVRLLQELVDDSQEVSTKHEAGQSPSEEQFKFAVDIDGHAERAYLKSITGTSDGLTTGTAEALAFRSPVQADSYRFTVTLAEGVWQASIESVAHIDND